MLSNRMNKIPDIHGSTASIIAIILFVVYLVNDFYTDPQIAIAMCYLCIIGLCIFIVSKETYFFKTIYGFVALFIFSFLVKGFIVYKKPAEDIIQGIINSFHLLKGSVYFKQFIATPHLYFYVVGLVLAIVYKYAPSLCKTVQSKRLMHILGNYSLLAIGFYICVLFCKSYEELEPIVFYTSIISAFWEVYTTESETPTGLGKASALIFEIGMLSILFPDLYTGLVESFKRACFMPWYYCVGLILICLVCLGIKESKKDHLIGIIFLGTSAIFVFERTHQISYGLLLVIIYHILALGGIYVLKILAESSRLNNHSNSTPLAYAFCYTLSFLLTTLIKLQYMQSIALLGLGILIMGIQFGGFAEIIGNIYGDICFGIIPWLLMETTMFLSGRLHIPLLPTITFTIMFWLSSSVALSWKDSYRIPTIVIEKNTAEMVLKGLAYFPYFLTAIILIVK